MTSNNISGTINFSQIAGVPSFLTVVTSNNISGTLNYSQIAGVPAFLTVVTSNNISGTINYSQIAGVPAFLTTVTSNNITGKIPYSQISSVAVTSNDISGTINYSQIAGAPASGGSSLTNAGLSRLGGYVNGGAVDITNFTAFYANGDIAINTNTGSITNTSQAVYRLKGAIASISNPSGQWGVAFYTNGTLLIAGGNYMAVAGLSSTFSWEGTILANCKITMRSQSGGASPSNGYTNGTFFSIERIQ